MNKIVLLINSFALCFGLDSLYSKRNTDFFFSLNNGIFFNYGTAGYETDGFIELQLKNGLFFETSITNAIEENIEMNSSIGFMKRLSPKLYATTGYSNYTEIKNETLNELFFGVVSKQYTGIVYLGIQGDLSPNFLIIIDFNSILNKNFPLDISLMNTYSQSSNNSKLKKVDHNESGFDTFLRFSTDFKSGISLGYNLSRELYETDEPRTYIKQGQPYTINRSITKTGIFHTIHIGYLF